MITLGKIRQAMLLALLVACNAQAAIIAGVNIEDTMQVAGNELVLNGAGLRTRLFFKVYVGALYVRAKTSSVTALLETAEPRRMVMRMLRSLDADALREALEEGLKNNLTATEFAGIKPQTEQLAVIMNGIGKVKEGDTIMLDLTASGVVVDLNGEMRGKVPGAGFSRALLKVWLGDKPVDESLKRALLGN
jgi:long-chain acyl-CoA synthetase